MKLYLAGGISGNLNPAWRRMAKSLDISLAGFINSLMAERFMKIYLAGGESKHWLQDKDKMKTYLAGVAPYRNERIYDDIILKHKPYILESFYYVDADTERLLPFFGDFLLDSGAFTFMQNTGHGVEWDEYIERYASFIKRNKVEKYFELDIDSVVGYPKVLEYRKKLERLVGWRCIPVWHNNRGKDEYIKTCKEYEYVAIGGLVGGNAEYSRKYWYAFPWFIKTAHENGAKIHALGFTSMEGIKRYHFDSVDSTSWTSGNRFGHVYYFDGKTIKKVDCPRGKRIGDARAAALINYSEWLKFQKYADAHL